MRTMTVPDEMLNTSALTDDIHDAVLPIQLYLGIKSGDGAGICLDSDKWAAADKDARLRMLDSWIDSESFYAPDIEDELLEALEHLIKVTEMITDPQTEPTELKDARTLATRIRRDAT